MTFATPDSTKQRVILVMDMSIILGVAITGDGACIYIARTYDTDREEKKRYSKVAGAARNAPFAAGLCNL